MKSEEQELEEGLAKAIKNKDGYLAHYYGSQLSYRERVRKEFKEERLKMEYKMKRLKQECEIRTQINVDNYKIGL